MAEDVALDSDEWHEHARWWDTEGPRVRSQLAVDDETLDRAKMMFGEIGSDTVGPALQEVLRARAQAGHALGTYCEGVAKHIRSSLNEYAGAEDVNRRTLST